AALLDRHQRAYATFAVFARRMRDEQRLEDSFADPDDADIRLTFGSTIIHVIQHNAQHRGEALHMLERLGVPGLPEGNPLEWELLTHST
ncbi:MAG: DinB family protein, partial [Thermomicrobiales bacterium]